MMKHSSRFQRILALVLAIAMVLSLGVGQVAATGAKETGLCPEQPPQRALRPLSLQLPL